MYFQKGVYDQSNRCAKTIQLFTMAQRKINSCTIEFKIEVLEEVSRGVKKLKEIAAFYKIPKSTLRTFVKDKDNIYAAAATSR